MRIKHLLTLKQIENQPPWKHIAIYWLGKDIYNYNKEFNLWKSSNITKTNKMPPPLFLLPGSSMLYKNPKSKHPKPTKQNQNNIQKYIRKKFPKSIHIR